MTAKCPVCGKNFKTVKAMRSHHTKKHTMEVYPGGPRIDKIF